MDASAPTRHILYLPVPDESIHNWEGSITSEREREREREWPENGGGIMRNHDAMQVRPLWLLPIVHPTAATADTFNRPYCSSPSFPSASDSASSPGAYFRDRMYPNPTFRPGSCCKRQY